MMNLKESLSLYAVTDRHWLKNETLASQVEKAIIGGASFVQLREKNAGEQEFYELAVDVQKVCRKHNVPFVMITLNLQKKLMLTAFMSGRAI